MHLIVSTRAGTDVVALTSAVRSFLHERFADHRFMFGVHTDKEAEGLKIVATSARERASSQSYGPRDKAIVEAADRPRTAREARDRAYASDPANHRLIDNARQRIRTARSNPLRLPASEAGRRAVEKSVMAWSAVAKEQPDNPVAQSMLARLTMAQTVGSILHAIGGRVDQIITKEDDMAITSAQMVKDLRLMNEAVARTSDLLDGQTKQQFQEASGRYLETLANRVDLQRAQERGVEQLTRAEIESLVGANADRLIERAREVQAKEVGEAASAAKLADHAFEAERRQEGRAGADPEAQRELRSEREVVAGAQRSAAREAREADAAVEAARTLAEHPAQPLAPGLIQTDALAKLKAEQERVLREIEAERQVSQTLKAQRIT